MAEDKTPSSAEDIEKELTAGKFAAVQLRTAGIMAGSTALGVGLGFGASRLGLGSAISKSNWFRKIFNKINPHVFDETGNVVAKISKTGEILNELGNAATGNGLAAAEKMLNRNAAIGLTVVGGAAGSAIGGMTSDYEHWRKVKGEQVRVKKIDHDVDKVMQSRITFEDTLNRQHDAIKALRERLENEKQETAAGQVISNREKPSEIKR